MGKNSNKKLHLDGIIYKYKNKINGKIYIGQTVNESSRMSAHRRSNSNTYFDNAIKKYGFENFEYKVLFRIHCNNENDLIYTLDNKEVIAIKYFQSNDNTKGYNLTSGGKSRHKISESIRYKFSRKGKDNPMFGKKTSEETRKLQSKAHKGKPLSDYHRQRISESLKGTVFSEERRKNISKSLTGKKKSNEARKNLSIAKTGSHISGTSVVQLDLNGNFIKEYKSIEEAGRLSGISRDGIKKCCARAKNGNNKATSGNYLWRYKNYWNLKDKIDPVERRTKLKVFKYTIDKKLIGEFNSILEASKSVKNSKSCRTFLCNKRKRNNQNECEFDGFIWVIKEI